MTTADKARLIRQRRSKIEGKKLLVRSLLDAHPDISRRGEQQLRALPAPLGCVARRAPASASADRRGQLTLDQLLEDPGDTESGVVDRLAP